MRGEFGEEVLDQMARRIQVAIEFSGLLSIGFRRNHRFLPRRGERLDDALVDIEGLVGDQHIGRHVGQEFIRADEIVSLATRQMKANRIAERIHQGVDFGAQSSARPSDRLVRADFFWAPALC